MKYDLPPLPYAYDALEPFIDKATMEVHHDKHHQTYADKMNAVLEKYPDLTQTPEDIMRNLDSMPFSDDDKKMFRNHGGGFINHNLFWQVMGPQKEIDAQLQQDVIAAYGSVDAFKEKFSALATGIFGSGWAWLVRESSGALQMYSTANQDSPLLQGHTPIIALDVWEHAYYLKYQNRRAEYISNWWNVLKVL